MDRRNELQIVVELALAGVTAAAVVGMSSLFEDSSFRGPLLFQVLLAHACVAALRRTKLNLLVALLTAAVASVVAISWSQYADTLWVLIPSTETWQAIQADLDQAQLVFSNESPPVPVEAGFVATISAAVWLVAIIADWAAFRLRLSFEALLPSVAAFLLATIFSQEQGLGAGASIYAAACLAFLLLHRTWGQEATAAWTSLYRRRARRVLLVTGTVLTAVAVVAGTVLGPNLPGADGQPIYDWRGTGDDDETRVVVSPLVDIRGRLVDTSEVEVFTVQTDGGGSYWRTTALDEFNGEIFKSSYRTDEADGPLPQAVDAATETQTLTQEVSIQALAEIWLPAAYEPTALYTDGAEVIYDEESSSLLVEESSDSSDNLTYVVESEVPSWTAEQLREASEEFPGDVADRYLQLPGDLDGRIREEALRITEGAETAYDQALALQNYLRTFDYTLDIELGHDEDAVVEFLLEIQEGYCEQFAGSFAAMARTLGLPTRVAVGFTQGMEDPNEEGLFRVRGEHAHAWPEVYFHGYGWVPFEPTPGRGPNNAEEWLGVSPQQHGEEAEDPPATPESENNRSEPTPTEPSEDQPGTGPDEAEGSDPAPDQAGGTLPGGEEDEASSHWYDRLLGPAKRIGLALAVYLVVVPAGLALQRHLRRRRARRPEQQVQLAWDETVEQAGMLGLAMTPAMTLNERAACLEADLPAASPAIAHMTTLLERYLYAGTPPAAAEAAAARQAADAVQVALNQRRSWPARIFDHLDARRLLPRHRAGGRRSAHGAERSR